MKIKTITDTLLRAYPLDLQEEWDQSGFLNKASLNRDINKVYVCLDLNEVVVNKAILNKVKLIISHHPIFKDEEHPLMPHAKRILAKIKKYKITVLSLHTCFDLAPQGMNILIGTMLKLNALRWSKNKQYVTGFLPKPMTAKQIAEMFRKTFGVSIVTSNAKNSDVFVRLAICAGAGLSCITPEIKRLENKSYLIVTGDIKHHGWQDLSHYNIRAMDVGHDLENCFADFIASLIKMNFEELNVVSIRTSKKESIY